MSLQHSNSLNILKWHWAAQVSKQQRVNLWFLQGPWTRHREGVGLLMKLLVGGRQLQKRRVSSTFQSNSWLLRELKLGFQTLPPWESNMTDTLLHNGIKASGEDRNYFRKVSLYFFTSWKRNELLPDVSGYICESRLAHRQDKVSRTSPFRGVLV